MRKLLWGVLVTLPLLFSVPLSLGTDAPAQMTEEETIQSISKDLSELQRTVIKLQKEIDKMTPEQKRAFCEKHPELKCK